MEYTKGEITVIVPCYKASKYMDDLLKNLQAQTFSKFKVLLVNDGDKHQCSAMEAIAKKDERIKIIWKENGGASSARNTAIDRVDTEWFVFVDADDKFGPNYLLNLYNSVNGTDATLGIGGYSQYFVKEGLTKYCFINVKEDVKVMAFHEAYDFICVNGIEIYPWNKIYKTQVIHSNHIYMDTTVKVIHDIIFNLHLYPHIEKVGLCKDTGYVYMMEDSESLVSTYDPNYERDMYNVISLQNKLNHQLGWSESKCKAYLQTKYLMLSRSIITNLYKRSCPLSFLQKYQRIKDEVFNKENIRAAVKNNITFDAHTKVHRILFLYTNAFVLTSFYSLYFCFRRCKRIVS